MLNKTFNYKTVINYIYILTFLKKKKKYGVFQYFWSKIPETGISTPTNVQCLKNPQDFFNNFGSRFIDIILKETDLMLGKEKRFY